MKNLRRLGKGSWETADVVGELAVVGQELDVGSIDEDLSGGLLLLVLLTTEWGETPVLGDNDLLASWELVLGAAEGLKGNGAVWKVHISLSLAMRNLRWKNLLESRVRTERMT